MCTYKSFAAVIISGYPADIPRTLPEIFKIDPIFPQTNFKKQEAAVKMFNNWHYVADKTNERNATPMAVARVLTKEEDDESEDENREEGWAPGEVVAKAEPASPIKAAIEPISDDQVMRKVDKLLEFFVTNKLKKSLSFEPTAVKQPLARKRFTCSDFGKVLNKVEVITHKCVAEKNASKNFN